MGTPAANIRGNGTAMGIRPERPALWARTGQRAQDGPDQSARQAAVVAPNGAEIVWVSPPPERGSRKRGDPNDRAIDGPASRAVGT